MMQHGGVRFWNDEQKIPYVVKDYLWVGYDDVQSITVKVSQGKYVMCARYIRLLYIYILISAHRCAIFN